jgi:hypothetical protein
MKGGSAVLRPRQSGDYPDRNLECQEALQPYFEQSMQAAQLLSMAVEAGWSKGDFNEALPKLERYRILELNDKEPQ